MLRTWIVLFAGLALPACTAFAQEGASLPAPREFHLPPRVGISGERPLTLQEALAMALGNNRDIDISRIDQQRAGYNVTSALGVFDPRIGGVSSFNRTISPVASALGGSTTGGVTTTNGIVDPQFSGALPGLGSSYLMDLSSARTTTSNTFTTLNPQYPSSLNFSYTQPLLRGLRYDDNRRRIEIAKKNTSLTDEQFRQRVMEVVTRTEQAYWDLAFAQGNLAVQLEAVQIAWDQDGSNRRQQAQGLLASIDVVAAQRQMATFEQAAYSAQEALTTAENALKALILADRDDPLWSLSILPTTPVDTAPPIVPLTDAINEALSTRPELAQLRISRDINKADNRYFRDQTKPQVDAIVTHTNAGLSGAQLPPTLNPFTGLPSAGAPGLLVGGYGTSLSNLFNGHFPVTQVQLRISLPLHNRTAEANLSNNIAEARRIRDQEQQAELAIEAAVRNGMQSVESSKARLSASLIARTAAEAQYESEQRQFRAGTSTLFLVQQRQTDMITARSQERRAESDLGKAVAAFELATGRTLRVHNIDLK